MKRVLLTTLALFGLLSADVMLDAGTAHAQVCAAKTNLTINPNQPLKDVTAGWFQWLNRSYSFSCSGSTSHLKCTHSSEAYDFYYYCDSNQCYVDAWDANGWRNEAVLALGNNIWGWTWDGGTNSGWVQMFCHPDLNNLQNPCGYVTYGTCD